MALYAFAKRILTSLSVAREVRELIDHIQRIAIYSGYDSFSFKHIYSALFVFT